MSRLEEGSILHDTYELVAPLGRGGMGVVWRAQHVRLPRQMAIKVLDESAYESEELLHRFRREAEITSQLGHPHIVQVFDFNVLADGRAYLVMELLRGESLRDRLKRGPIEPAATLEILRQVGSALARAHQAGVVHRDLKPENIFLCADDGPNPRPHAKVLDFGISKIQGSQTVVTQESALLGTPKYMSPEQAKGENAELDARTDQFALGAIAYEMMTGQPAFAGTSVTSVLYKVLHEDPRPVTEISGSVAPSFDSAIRRALAKDREARFESIEAFLDAITTAPAGASPLSTPSSVGANDADTVPDPSRANPAPVSGDARPTTGGRGGKAALSLFVVVLAAGGYGLWSTVGGPPEVVTRPLAEGPADAEPAGATGPGGAVRIADASSVEARADDAVDAGPAVDARVVPGGDAPASDEPPRRRPSRRLGPNLREARTALEAAEYDRAIRLAERGLREDEGPFAHRIRAVAYCGKRDLASARAALRLVPRRHRRAVVAACREHGIGLD